MPTIAEIARAAGVSEMTVSRVVNGVAQYRRPTFTTAIFPHRPVAVPFASKPAGTFAAPP